MHHRCTTYNRSCTMCALMCSPRHLRPEILSLVLQMASNIQMATIANFARTCNEVLLHSTDKYCLSCRGRKCFLTALHATWDTSVHVHTWVVSWLRSVSITLVTHPLAYLRAAASQSQVLGMAIVLTGQHPSLWQGATYMDAKSSSMSANRGCNAHRIREAPK